MRITFILENIIDMKNSFSYPPILMLVAFTVVVFFVITMIHFLKEKEFQCWARLYSLSTLDDCQRRSSFDVFFSFQGNGEGYFLSDGTSSCRNEIPKPEGGLINFSYKKQGDYLSIHMEEKSKQLSKFFSILNYNYIKLKITHLNSDDYVLTLPNENLLICTED